MICHRCNRPVPTLAALAGEAEALADAARAARGGLESMRLALPDSLGRGVRDLADRLPGLARALRCYSRRCLP